MYFPISEKMLEQLNPSPVVDYKTTVLGEMVQNFKFFSWTFRLFDL